MQHKKQMFERSHAGKLDRCPECNGRNVWEELNHATREWKYVCFSCSAESEPWRYACLKSQEE